MSPIIKEEASMTPEQIRSSALIAAELYIGNILAASQFSRDLFNETLISGFAVKRITGCFESYISGAGEIPDINYQARSSPGGAIRLVHEPLHKALFAEEDIQNEG
jgi:hypothetical protein